MSVDQRENLLRRAQFGRETDVVPMLTVGAVLRTLNCPEDSVHEEYESLGLARDAGLVVILEGRSARLLTP